MSATPELGTPWRIGPVEVPNRVLLAPLAGIGNWFVRLQAKRYGAGLAVSEMVSSFAIHHRNEKTMRELLRIHPDERAAAGRSPSSSSATTRTSCARRRRTVAEHGADLIDLNMGCPVPKVCKTGAGAALIKDPDTAVAVARAAREGSRAAGHRQAALRPAPGGDRRLRARPPPRPRRRRQRDRLPPAQRRGAPQGHARLRPRGPPGGNASMLRSILTGGLSTAQAVHARPRAHRRGGGHARARLARQPVAVRAGARHAGRPDRPTTRSSPSCNG